MKRIKTICALAMCGIIGLVIIAESRQADMCSLTIELVDAQSGKPLPGWIRFRDADGNRITVSELLPRDLTPGVPQSIEHWSVLVQKSSLQVPRKRVVIEALFGLETELGRITVDLTDKSEHQVQIPLKTFFRASEMGTYSANTHLHLMKLSREMSDRYLTEIPKSDGLDVLFVSYLERADVQKDYITNVYTSKDLADITRRSGVQVGNGEEHRHNFTAQGQGFGHVMLLDIKELVLPVSIGQGIMKTGTDGLPLQRGIDQARRDGATVIWCHNDWGLEDLPNIVAGRIQALNIFDGNKVTSYKHSFYRYLNAGFKVPFSTGTDWFMYDVARVYVRSEKPITSPKEWLKCLADGKSYITNGPFLEFRIAGKEIGDTVMLDSPKQVEVIGKAIGRVDFERIELVENGVVIKSEASRPEAGHFVAEMKFSYSIKDPVWLALRLPPQPIKDNPEFSSPVPLNELGQPLFAHTSPIYVQVGQRRVFDVAIARSMMTEMETSVEFIRKEGRFADAEEQARVLSVYAQGIDTLRKKLQLETQ